MENGVEISGVENTEQLNTRCIQHQKKLLFSGNEGKNTENGAENTGVEYLNFLLYKAPGVEYGILNTPKNLGIFVFQFLISRIKVTKSF